MAVVSLLLGIFSFLLAAAGVVFSIVPYVGVVSSVLSLVSAVAGIITGARAHSRARDDGGDTTFPIIGLVINCIMFLMALCVTATCGACNTLITNSERDGSLYFGPDGAMILDPAFDDRDGSVVDPALVPTAPTAPAVPVEPPPQDPAQDPGAAPIAPAAPNGAGTAPPASPPPAFPPPPMNAPGR